MTAIVFSVLQVRWLNRWQEAWANSFAYNKVMHKWEWLLLSYLTWLPSTYILSTEGTKINKVFVRKQISLLEKEVSEKYSLGNRQTIIKKDLT